MIYLLTVNYNCAELIKRLIASLNDDLSATLIIVNNSTEDKNIQSLAAERVKIIEAGENLGFGKGC
ncbi:MAG: glycosyltransferase family 2 protein, partial [Microcystis sp.]